VEFRPNLLKKLVKQKKMFRAAIYPIFPVKTEMASKYIIAVFLVWGAIISCKKQNDSGCISRVVPLVTQTSLRPSQLDSVQVLFAANNLSTSGLQFLSFGPYYSSPDSTWTAVSANVFKNGLLCDNFSEYFEFNKGILSNSDMTSAVPLNDDTTGHRSLPFLRQAFLQHVSESKMLGGPLHATHPVYSASQFANTCLQAKLIYIDSAYLGYHGGSPLPVGKYLAKAWEVSPEGLDFPAVYVQDATGTGWGKILDIP
jgi:hypothetical protein